MPSIDLTYNEWGQVMNILATTKEWPWTITNPLLMKIGDQLRVQHAPIMQPRPSGDGKEQHHE